MSSYNKSTLQGAFVVEERRLIVGMDLSHGLLLRSIRRPSFLLFPQN